MKTLPLNHFKTALLAVFFLILQSCQPTIPGTWKNEKISSGKRDDFHHMTAEAFRDLKNNDPNAMKMRLSKEMNAKSNEGTVEHLSNYLKDYKYELLDEYYVVNKYKDTDTVVYKSGDINRYGLVYPAAAQEMYFAFFLPKKGENKYMISLIYAKLDYGWKIIKMDLSPYTINGKTGPELYNLAQEQLKKNQTQAALNNIKLAITCFKPCDYWQYPDQGDAEKFYTRVREEIKAEYHYPLVLSQIATGPMILNIYTKNVDDETCPAIYYMTHFPLKDTTDIKKENLEIRAVVHKIMPGLDQDARYMLYSAFNKQPNGYQEIDHFDMTQKIR